VTTHIHRVIVRGFFDGLDDSARERLTAELDEHDVLRSAFTAAGSLTYGRDLSAFSFRFEVRTTDDDGDATESAMRTGMERAEASLHQLGLGHKRLRATATDMADMWRSASRRVLGGNLTPSSWSSRPEGRTRLHD
jgi:hypothetical protein